ncbi:MAG: PhoH family protein [Candidatus Woesearchaeota archaeon]|jgi:predicted ribonuclease YlaK
MTEANTETTTRAIDDTYHKIIVPLSEIYSLGGPDTFKHLERRDDNKKNLVVLPKSVFNELNYLSKQKQDYGALDTADFITTHESNISSTDNELTIYRLYEGLDLAVMHEQETSFKDLEKKIKTDFNQSPDRKLEFVTNDPFKNIELKNKGLNAKKSDFLLVSADIVNKGIITTSNPDFMAKIFQNPEKGIMLEDINWRNYFDEDPFINQFIHLTGKDSSRYARITCDLIKKNGKIIDHENVRIVPLQEDEYSRRLSVGNHQMNSVLGIHANDMEQYLALQYGLLNPDISLFFLTGTQGSGKTILSYAAAIDQMLWYDKLAKLARGTPESENSFFKKLILLKPNNIMGGKERDIGFLPGSMYEKLKPHLMPYVDSHNKTSLAKKFPFEELLKHPKFVNEYGGPRFDSKVEASQKKDQFKINGEAYLPADSEVIEIAYSGFFRGRSFEDTLIIVDEGENYSPYELKTIIERAGIGSKVVVLGDPFQVDNAKNTREINGLTGAIKQYLPMSYSSLIHLTGNYRSTMSEDTKSWRVYSS